MCIKNQDHMQYFFSNLKSVSYKRKLKLKMCQICNFSKVLTHFQGEPFLEISANMTFHILTFLPHYYFLNDLLVLLCAHKIRILCNIFPIFKSVSYQDSGLKLARFTIT